MPDSPTSQLFLELDRLGERPLKIDYAYPAASLDLDDPAVQLIGDVTGQVTFARMHRDIVAHGRLAAVARGACARCLAPADAKLAAQVDELWIKKSADERGGRRDDEDEDEDGELEIAHPLTGDRIELAGIFREVLLAELPDRFLCKEDCKGLCPECGADLNAGPCGCALKSPSGKEKAKEDSALPEWKKRLKGLHLDE